MLILYKEKWLIVGTANGKLWREVTNRLDTKTECIDQSNHIACFHLSLCDTVSCLERNVAKLCNSDGEGEHARTSYLVHCDVAESSANSQQYLFKVISFHYHQSWINCDFTQWHLCLSTLYSWVCVFHLRTVPGTDLSLCLPNSSLISYSSKLPGFIRNN